MYDRAVTQPVGRRGRVIVTSALQIAVALGATLWAARLRDNALEQETTLGPGFWGFVALAIFCGMLAVVNLLLPLLRFSYPAPRPDRQRLAHSLSSISNSTEVARELFGLGLAFVAPALPLALMTRGLSTNGSDWTLLGVGALLLSLVIGGILLFVTGRQLYTRAVGGDVSVDLDELPLRRGDTSRLVVSYVPGRLEPTRINVRVLCLQTGRDYVVPKDERVLGARTTTRREVYNTTIHKEDFSRFPTLWEYVGQLAIPDKALLSDTTNPRSVIDWFLEVEVAFTRAPDVTFVFPFKVVA